MAKKCYKERGGMSIIGMLATAVIAILVLSYFNISLKSIVENPESVPGVTGVNKLIQSPRTDENVKYITGGVTNIWTTYLQKPLTAFWNNIWIVYIWEPFVDNMERIQKGEPTDFQLNAPEVPQPKL